MNKYNQKNSPTILEAFKGYYSLHSWWYDYYSLGIFAKATDLLALHDIYYSQKNYTPFFIGGAYNIQVGHGITTVTGNNITFATDNTRPVSKPWWSWTK